MIADQRAARGVTTPSKTCSTWQRKRHDASHVVNTTARALPFSQRVYSTLIKTPLVLTRRTQLGTQPATGRTLPNT